jgi:hypothetical protein
VEWLKVKALNSSPSTAKRTTRKKIDIIKMVENSLLFLLLSLIPFALDLG